MYNQPRDGKHDGHGMEWAGSVAVQERAMVILLIEAATARRRLQALLEHMLWQGKAPQKSGVTQPGRVGDLGINARNHMEPLTGREQLCH